MSQLNAHSRQLNCASGPVRCRPAVGALGVALVTALIVGPVGSTLRANAAESTPVASGESQPVARASAEPSAAPTGSGTDAGAPSPATQSQQNAPKRNPESPLGTPSAVPQHFSGLFGDLGGARPALAANGFSFNGHIVSEFAANATGGYAIDAGRTEQRGTALSTEVGVGFDADLGKLTHSGAGIIHTLVTTRFGSNLSSNVVGNLVSVQEIYGDGQTTRFTFLDYEQPLFNNKLNLLIGKINQQNDFIAGPTYWGGNLYCFYQNNNICGTPAGIPVSNGVTPAGSAGYNYYPSSMWGARLKVSPSKSVYIEGAALQVNPIVNTNHGGAYFGFFGDTGTELPLEIGVTLRDKDGNGVGDVRFGGYYDTSNVLDYRAGAASFAVPNNASNAAALSRLPLQYVRGRSGYYVQFDHLLDGSAKADRPGTAIFISGEYSDPNTALLTSYIDAGIVRHGTFAQRPDDTIAIGFSTANFNPRLQRLELALQGGGYTVPFSDAETALELNYGIQASSWLVIRPGLQYVINPKGEQSNVPAGLTVPKNALVFGLGTYISF